MKAAVKNVTDSKRIFSGIVTGQVAGLIMAVAVMLVFTLFLGKNPFYPVQVIGSVLFGENALHGFNFGALVAACDRDRCARKIIMKTRNNF